VSEKFSKMMNGVRIGHLLNSQTRTGRFFRTLATSYVQLGAATVYSFFLIPLVLQFENPEGLGLWLLIAQVGGYLTVMDAGLSSLSIRQFVGMACEGDFQRLAPRFQATLALSTAQGLLICLTGLSGPWFAELFKISENMGPLFCQLFLAQCLVVGLSFPVRPFSSLLLAVQRFEANYLVSSASFLVALFLTWWGFKMGWGLWSVFIGNCFQWLASGLTSILKVKRMGGLKLLFRPDADAFRLIPGLCKESLAFASSSFFPTVAGFLQSAILSRFFGLEGVALWNVGAKIATVLSQILSKLFESSFGGLSELAEKGLGSQMRIRFLTLWASTSGISVFLAICLIWANGPFVDWWTGGALAWPIEATWGVALWLVTTTITKGIAEQTKVLLLWRQIRWGPLLDFLALAAFVSTVFLSPRLKIYAFALALAPLSGSFIWNARSLYLCMQTRRSSR